MVTKENNTNNANNEKTHNNTITHVYAPIYIYNPMLIVIYICYDIDVALWHDYRWYIYNIYYMYIESMEDTNTYIHRYTYITHQSLLDPRHCSIHPYIYVYIYFMYLFILSILLFSYLFIKYITCAKNIHLHIISMYYGHIKSSQSANGRSSQADTSPELGGCDIFGWIDLCIYIYVYISGWWF
jgi:hypothetical protein